MKNTITRLSFLLIAISVIFACNSNENSRLDLGDQTNEVNEPSGQKWQSIKGALEYEEMITKDPALGYVPADRLINATKIARERQSQMAEKRNNGLLGTLDEAEWESRGPDNIGGRTRAIHIDLNDPERKKVWVGSVGGGLWVTEDITASDPQWRIINDYWQNLAIGAIAQDPTNPEIFYVSTGEGYGSLSSVRGNGIFKSVDGGETWEHLPFTIGKSAYRAVQDIIIDNQGQIYLGTSTHGLHKSTNNGQSFFQVLGLGNSGGTGNFIDDLYILDDGTIYLSTHLSIHKSQTGNTNDWQNIGNNRPGFPTNLQRVEFSICKTDHDIIYLVGNIGGAASDIYYTTNGGQEWLSRPVPTTGGGNFASNQAWYDLEIAINPFDCNRIIVGGVPVMTSNFQGLSWNANYSLHVDQHFQQFDDKIEGVVYFGNDGGIWRSANGPDGNIQDKNRGYITTQFYACALHPEAGSNFMLGGTQDNNSLQLNSPNIGSAINVRGGDGAFCFIDQNQPNIQIVSSQNGNYEATTNGDLTNENRSAGVNGGFINVSDYDNDANFLYGETGNGDFFRWHIESSDLDFVDIANQNTSGATAFLADPNVPNKLWIGDGTRIYTVDNAHEGLSVNATNVIVIPGGGSIRCIYIDKLVPNDILITKSNYGVQSVFISNNAGSSFTSIEGDLPDMPVRWAIFDPFDHTKALIATELGIWSTDKIDGSETKWVPSNQTDGAPFIRTDMLQIRESDKVVLSASHGRGLYTTNVFQRPTARINIPDIVYSGIPFSADGSGSILAESHNWNFGDGSNASGEIVDYTFSQPGVFTVELKINGTISATKEIIVLPSLGVPYIKGGAVTYDGDFESNLAHFAGVANSGSLFSRGNSTIAGKNGTASGAQAYVLGLNESEYQPNTTSYLYTPAYDFSQITLYNISFMSRFLIHNKFDGFKVEYATQVGGPWKQLGNANSENWYNYNNQNLEDAAFLQGEHYFTGTQAAFTKYGTDISTLAGNSFVAFRFVFKSESSGFGVGVAIDDFIIERFEGKLETQIAAQSAGYINDNEITISWSTEPEFQAVKFDVERSYDGINYNVIETVPATGKLTQVPQSYSITISEIRPTIFYKIHSINENPAVEYLFNFRAPTLVVKRNPDETPAVFNIFPNPFTDRISVTFNNIINEDVTARLFDVSGRLIGEQILPPNDVFLQFANLNVGQGIYLLNIQIGEEEPKTFKLFSGN